MTKQHKAAAIAAAALIGVSVYAFMPPKPAPVEKPPIQQPEPIHGVGIIDLARIQAKHPEGEMLKELQSRELRLKLELDEAMRPLIPAKPPEVEEEPFDEAAHQKNMQNFMEQMAALKAKKVSLAEEFRDETREEYLRRRDAVRDVYLNAALNITLKIDNADNLKLSAEQVRALQKELDELVMERNAKQLEMLNEWTAQINQLVEAATAGEEERIRREAVTNLQKYEADAAAKVQEIQERNKNLAENAAKEIEARQNRRKELLQEFNEVSKARANLENKILNDITDEAGKLGALHRLEMVLVSREPIDDENNFVFKPETNFSLKTKKPPGAIIFPGNDTTDLTGEIIKQLELMNQDNLRGD